MFAEPFNGWSAHEREEGEEEEATEATAVTEEHQAVSAGDTDEAPVTCTPAPSAPTTVSRTSTSLPAEATPFVFPGASNTPTPPISMPRTASSLSRERSPSTSGLKEGQEGRAAAHSLQYGVSVTPRGSSSPFAHFSASDPLSSPDLASTPSATSHHRASPSGDTNTETGSAGAGGYDPAVLKSLIWASCTAGDLPRLQTLLSGGDGSDDSLFALANRPLTSSALTPLHLAAARGHIEVSSGARPLEGSSN